MKAIRITAFGPPEVMQLQEIPQPSPGPGQILVRLHAIGVNPVEAYIRSGIYGPVPFPYTPGTDAAGTIETIGPGITTFALGDRVYTAGSLSGTYAQFALCTPDQVHQLPDHITFQQGAALGVPYGTAYRALFIRGQARTGETVLIHGASGGVGLAAVQLAKAAGLTIIGTAGTDAGLKLVQQQGAHHVLNHATPNYLDQIPALTQNRGPDLILEMLANKNLAADLAILAPRGRVVIIGSRGKIEIDPRLTMSRDLDIRGMSLRNATSEELLQIHTALITGLQNKTLAPIIDPQIPLAEAPRAHHEVMQSGSAGKIVLIP